MYIKVGREFVDDCYNKGVVKPNEFRQVVRNLVDKELNLRSNLPIHKKVGFFWVSKDLDIAECEHFYFSNSKARNIEDAIVNIAYENKDKLLLSPEEIKLLILADNFYRKSVIIRDCSDILRSKYKEDDFLYVDKKTLRTSDYLQKYSQAGWGVLKTLTDDTIEIK